MVTAKKAGKRRKTAAGVISLSFAVGQSRVVLIYEPSKKKEAVVRFEEFNAKSGMRNKYLDIVLGEARKLKFVSYEDREGDPDGAPGGKVKPL